jgi:hypothetical protein
MFDNDLLIQAYLDEHRREVDLAVHRGMVQREARIAARSRRTVSRVRFWTGGVLIGAGRYLQSKRAWESVAHG